MRLNRRTFLNRSAGAAASLAAAAALPASAQQQPSPAGEADEVSAKLARVVALYGDRLNPEQRQRMRRTIAGHVSMLQVVRAVPLQNSDPPASVLRLVTAAEDRHD
ncbi:MAG: twin-arginine translocation signal domain-containing protein [Terriglobales bacterium]